MNAEIETNAPVQVPRRKLTRLRIVAVVVAVAAYCVGYWNGQNHPRLFAVPGDMRQTADCKLVFGWDKANRAVAVWGSTTNWFGWQRLEPFERFK